MGRGSESGTIRAQSADRVRLSRLPLLSGVSLSLTNQDGFLSDLQPGISYYQRVPQLSLKEEEVEATERCEKQSLFIQKVERYRRTEGSDSIPKTFQTYLLVCSLGRLRDPSPSSVLPVCILTLAAQPPTVLRSARRPSPPGSSRVFLLCNCEVLNTKLYQGNARSRQNSGQTAGRRGNA